MQWKRRKRFRYLVELLVTLFCIMRTLGAMGELVESGSEVATALEQFKTFLSSPPLIEKLVFERKLPLERKPSGATNEMLPVSKDITAFEARWQPGALLFRELVPPASSEPALSSRGLIAILENRFWRTTDQSHVCLWIGPRSLTAMKAEHFYSVTQVQLETLRRALHFGIMHLDLGAIRWEGNKFRVRGTLEPYVDRVEGEVQGSEQGIPECMKVSYLGENGSADYVIRYGFDHPTQQGFLPTRFTNFWVGKGKELNQGEWTILELKTGRNPLSSSSFDPRPFIEANGWQMRISTNHAIYDVLSDGRHRLVQSELSIGAIKPRHSEESVKLILIYTGVASANWGIFILALRMKKQQQQTLNAKI